MDMNSGLQKKVEKVIGKIHTIELLEEQGCTSEVRRVCSNNGAYLLKSAYLEKYRKWLKTEATVLENFLRQDRLRNGGFVNRLRMSILKSEFLSL